MHHLQSVRSFSQHMPSENEKVNKQFQKFSREEFFHFVIIFYFIPMIQATLKNKDEVGVPLVFLRKRLQQHPS